jgi:hypothetical protein
VGFLWAKAFNLPDPDDFFMGSNPRRDLVEGAKARLFEDRKIVSAARYVYPASARRFAADTAFPPMAQSPCSNYLDPDPRHSAQRLAFDGHHRLSNALNQLAFLIRGKNVFDHFYID